MRNRYSNVTLTFLLFIVFLFSNELTNNVSAQNDLDVLFQDDFEEGPPEQWELGAGWQVVEDLDGNHVLNGEDHYWASPLVEGWSDYEINAKFKIISGGFHLNFRISEHRVSDAVEIFTRYLLGIHTDGLYLEKQIGSEFIFLIQHPMQINQNEWYSVKISLEGNLITVFINDEPVITFINSTKPLLFGSFAFETLADSHVLIDDVLILGELQPTDIPGYTWLKTGGPSGGLGYDVRIHPQNKDPNGIPD